MVHAILLSTRDRRGAATNSASTDDASRRSAFLYRPDVPNASHTRVETANVLICAQELFLFGSNSLPSVTVKLFVNM